jgi:hypothetical protein
MKFHENSCSESRDLYGHTQTDGHDEDNRLFCNFASSSNKTVQIEPGLKSGHLMWFFAYIFGNSMNFLLFSYYCLDPFLYAPLNVLFNNNSLLLKYLSFTVLLLRYGNIALL